MAYVKYVTGNNLIINIHIYITISQYCRNMVFIRVDSFITKREERFRKPEQKDPVEHYCERKNFT